MQTSCHIRLRVSQHNNADMLVIENSDEHMSNRKIGPNERCPCGSGRKYKHCCGSYSMEQLSSSGSRDGERLALLRATISEHEAKETRRRQQQGLGRPIIST